MDSEKYIGNELALFDKAHNWKGYYKKFIEKYLKGKVLEVGAGIGGTTKSLCDGHQSEWVCLEPDASLINEIEVLVKEKKLPACCTLVKGTLKDINPDKKFNAIIYIDVIEHIEDDKAELERAAKYLEPGGALIVLVPAHQWLFSPFDTAIGHYRRYNKRMLKNAGPKDLKLKELKYLDSVGLLASSVNKLFLKQSYPTLKQIYFWDRFLVRASFVGDVITNYNLGKSVVGVWIKPDK